MWRYILVLVLVTAVRSQWLMEILEKRKLYSEFASLLKTTPGIHQVYLNNSVTVFAPSNESMKYYTGPKNAAFLQNHMVSSAVSKSEMGERMTSILAGHPPLWVRMTATDSTTSTVYVNQARVVFVYQLSPPNTQNIKQFLYLIDSVLEPLVPVDTGAKEHFVDIKAGDVLRYPNRYSLGDFSVKKIAERVASLGWDKFPEYSSYGKFTFFLPVDLAFHKLRVGTIDEDVVRAHIIPDKLLFTHPVKRRMPSVPTLQYNSTRGSLALRVMAKIFEKDGVSMVESQTVVGTKRHGRGTVEAQIVRANIPVQNGIVHLIDRPLVVMASTVWQHLDPSQPNNQRFRMFAEYVQQSPGLAAKIKDPNNVFEGTVFIPTNEAFNFLSKDKMNETISSDMDRILGLHFLDQTIQTDDIRVLNPQADSGMFSTVAAWPSNTKSRVWLWDKDGTIQVDGGGVQAEVVEANVGASNGVIHSIDRVLGIPRDTIHDKLAMDPMMTKTFNLGNQYHFNDDLKKTDTNFTYLVPTDKAWDAVRDEMASAHKVLFMGEFFYQSEHILQRHLKVGSAHSLASLLRRGSLDVKRGTPLVVTPDNQEEGETAAYISYDGITAKIVRADIECTNGYIHLIDRVIMKRRDVVLGGVTHIIPSLIGVTVSWILALLLI